MCYERALMTARTVGTPIRALLICNPHNPLGRCYPPEVLLALMDLANEYKIHLIVDEIYAMSTYTTGAASASTTLFHSALSLPWREHMSPNYLHVLYGFSKDLASGGLRLGCICSQNASLIRALMAQRPFNWPGNIPERIASHLFLQSIPANTRDLEQAELRTKWLDRVIGLNRSRLAQSSLHARDRLARLGIPFDQRANAGFFLWIDLRRALPGTGKTGWEAERDLARRLTEEGVFITPGESMNAEEAGFFRLCFTRPTAYVEAGIERIGRVTRDLVKNL